ncbi:DUF5682 family protein [Pseudomarimonas arenosa]|uniref:Uncharacterized protein n=1 Tax=Pseudomarimonas arenosa TaxID=2774145 RepID=A0AAW3ZNF4_9GAMM|nr:DUF5682 family protein [Pseudomarimonas arenosa]MBD8527670.1 hypothetical protein [Pseudomarimonas arenosa]
MDTAQIRDLAAQLISPALVVYPVRHHSPACAWYLQQLITECQPSLVLVEGPRSFTPMIPLLVNQKAKMPLAIYTYAVRKAAEDQAESRRAAYYPFCDYSPELVALREADRLGIPARFIDLDFGEQCALEAGPEAEEHSLLDERHYRRSEHLHALANQLGCRDHEELWEHLFEADLGKVTWHEHLARVTAYCAVSREDCSEQVLSADGTLQREAEMLWHIQQALTQRDVQSGPVLAVVGGFHAVAFPAQLQQAVVRPKVLVPDLQDQASALIRYGFDRLDRLNGYAAGMTSPGWHQALWQRLQRHESAASLRRVREQAALETLTDIAIELRDQHGLSIAMPALAAAYEQVLRLTQLRQRPAPARNDVLDAVTSCFIKGDIEADGTLILSVARHALCGKSVGTVPPGAHTPPLVKDVAWRLRRQRLKVEDSQPRRAVLDIYRRPAHRISSRLLHGLSFLGIPFAIRTAGPDFANGIGLDRLQEHWEYAYSAATEAALVEASMYGVTLPLAVAQKFAEQLLRMQAEGQARDARAAASMMARACVLGLHDHLPKVLAMLRSAVAEDAGFDAVVDAVSQLSLLWQSREPLEARGLDEVPSLILAAYERAIYLGHGLQGGGTDIDAIIRALGKLRELLVSAAGHALDAQLYWTLLAELQRSCDSPLLRGAVIGLRYSAGQLDERTLNSVLAGHFQGLAATTDAVALLRGLLSTAREAAWQQPILIDFLNNLLSGWTQQDFVNNLPELRLAFAGMTPKETDRIAEAVAQLHGLESLGPLLNREMDAADVQQHLQVSATVAELLSAEGLGAWVAP